MNGWEYRFADYTEAQQLGKEGWEIISFNWDNPIGKNQCLLKRAVPKVWTFTDEDGKTMTITDKAITDLVVGSWGEPCPES